MRLDLFSEGYGFTITVTATGEQSISQIEVSCNLRYTDGTNESRTAILGAIDVNPGETFQHYALVDPPSQSPYYNPRIILTSKTVNTVDYGQPEITCRQIPLQ